MAEFLKKKQLDQGSSFLLGNEWPFKPNLNLVTNILSKKYEDDTIDNSIHAPTSISKRPEPIFVWEKFSSFMKLQRYVCFFCGADCRNKSTSAGLTLK